MIWILLFGILCGTFAGLIPGVGVFVTLAITYPIIIQFGLYEIILFYVALASTTQYIGSVPAILFGVPGESSSLPAVKTIFIQYLCPGLCINCGYGHILVAII